MPANITPHIIAFVQENPSFTKFIAFGTSLLGSLPGANFVVPSGTILNAIGVLVGAGLASWTVVLWAAIGAAIGTSASFALGRGLGPHARRLPILRQRLHLFQRAEEIFAKYGVTSLVIGYFSGPLRAPIAIIAAIAGMSRRRFEIANGMIALLWSAASVLIGSVPGSFANLGDDSLVVMLIAVPAAAVVVSALVVFVRKLLKRRRSKAFQSNNESSGAPL